MAKIRAFIRRQDGPELFFHFLRFFVGGQAQPAAYADAVGITYHTAGDTIQVTQQQIGGFTAYTGDP